MLIGLATYYNLNYVRSLQRVTAAVHQMQKGWFANRHTAVLLYEIALTFKTEVEVVWRHKPSLMAILHIFNHDVQVIGYALAFLSFVPRSSQVSHSRVMLWYILC